MCFFCVVLKRQPLLGKERTWNGSGLQSIPDPAKWFLPLGRADRESPPVASSGGAFQPLKQAVNGPVLSRIGRLQWTPVDSVHEKSLPNASRIPNPPALSGPLLASQSFPQLPSPQTKGFDSPAPPKQAVMSSR